MQEKRAEKKILSYRDFMERAAGVYVLIMFTVFPLFVHNGYLEVSDDKYYVFVFSTIALALVFAAASAVELIRVLRGTAEEKKALKASLAPKAVLRRLSVPDR